MTRMKGLHLALCAALPLTLAACELAPKTSQQNGYRGTGMDQIYVTEASLMDDVPGPPYELPEDTGGPRASDVYENVQVLGNVSVDEFNYLMAAMTEWVSPAEGCNYCHNPADMASDEVYTKGVARRMIQMTQNVNENWSDHVSDTGVTCWTCHRGNNVPEAVWTLPVDMVSGGNVRNRNRQNNPTSNTAYTSLPEESVVRYLLGGIDPDDDIGVVSDTMHPTDAHTLSTMDTEQTYALMMHMSQSLGVNCTYCHNSQSFQAWNISAPPRETAWFGIRMVRNINGEYITPLTNQFPDNRLGPAGDPYKVNCVTCHQGQNLPMGGARMAADYPALWRGAPPPAADDAEEMAAPEVEDAN